MKHECTAYVCVRTREKWMREKNVWKYVEYAENWNSSKTTWRHGGRHTTWTMMRWYSVSLKAISASDKNSVASLLIDGKFLFRAHTDEFRWHKFCLLNGVRASLMGNRWETYVLECSVEPFDCLFISDVAVARFVTENEKWEEKK